MTSVWEKTFGGKRVAFAMRRGGYVVGALVAAVVLVGCVQVSQENLRSGYSALGAKDYNRALTLADAEIKKGPKAVGLADAYYLRGAALENRPAATPSVASQNRLAAMAAYEQALASKPSKELAGYTRASMGNVAFFQEDYNRAAELSRQAYGDLDRPNEKAIVLLRAGQSLQRTGRFEEADRLFDQVIREFPGTVQAKSAASDRGARAYWVQLGVYKDIGNASRAESDARRAGARGVMAGRDARGMYVIRVGPLATYAAAKGAKAQVSGTFPGAVIQP